MDSIGPLRYEVPHVYSPETSIAGFFRVKLMPRSQHHSKWRQPGGIARPISLQRLSIRAARARSAK